MRIRSAIRQPRSHKWPMSQQILLSFWLDAFDDGESNKTTFITITSSFSIKQCKTESTQWTLGVSVANQAINPRSSFRQTVFYLSWYSRIGYTFFFFTTQTNIIGSASVTDLCSVNCDQFTFGFCVRQPLATGFSTVVLDNSIIAFAVIVSIVTNIWHLFRLRSGFFAISYLSLVLGFVTVTGY